VESSLTAVLEVLVVVLWEQVGAVLVVVLAL
jgi:hypothetical protein